MKIFINFIQNTIIMKIGDQLRKLRGNVSQTKIAQDLEISQTAYNKWESNKSKPTVSNLIKLAEYYNKNLYELIGLEAKINFYDSNVEIQILYVKIPLSIRNSLKNSCYSTKKEFVT